MPSTKRNNSRRMASRRRAPRASAFGHPPQIQSNVRVRHTYRFTSSSATATAITPTSTLGAMGGISAAANTNVSSFFGSFLVREVKIYTPPASQGAAATCSLEWIGLANSPNVEVSDTTVSVSDPAVIRARPPVNSLASFWQLASTTPYMTLTAPVGSIIDISLEGVLFDDDVAQAVNAVAASSLGSVYYLSLDPNATHRYAPVSLTTTT